MNEAGTIGYKRGSVWLDCYKESSSGDRPTMSFVYPHAQSCLDLTPGSSAPSDATQPPRFQYWKQFRRDTSRLRVTKIFSSRDRGPSLAFKYATGRMPRLFIAVLLIKSFAKMRDLPGFHHLCLKTIPLTLTLLLHFAPGTLAAPSFGTSPLAKRHAPCSCRSPNYRLQLKCS